MILDTINISLNNINFDLSKILKVVVFQHLSQQWFINLVVDKNYFSSLMVKNKTLNFFPTPIYTFAQLLKFNHTNENFLIFLSDAQMHHPVDRLTEFEFPVLNDIEFEFNKRKFLA